MRIKGCIFDLGGTIVDKYSLSPFISLKHAFKCKNININNNLIYKDMGKDKKQHIINIFKDKYISRNWYQLYGNYPLPEDIENIHDNFKKIQLQNCKYIEIIPETKNCFQFLKDNNIKTGCTTGFNLEIMNKIKTQLQENNIYLDSHVSSTCIEGQSRPEPSMIYKNMENLNIDNPTNIIKIDDTNIGIEEGKNAKCWTVGVARWSTYMNVLPSELSILNRELIESKKIESRKTLEKSKPDFIIDTLDELPNIINKLILKFIDTN